MLREGIQGHTKMTAPDSTAEVSDGERKLPMLATEKGNFHVKSGKAVDDRSR
jgi:hypothetical protein